MIPTESSRLGRWRSVLFTVVMTMVSRGLIARDWLFGRMRGLARPERAEEFWFASGDRRLAGVYVGSGAGAPVMLICHGIGETVENWRGVQAMLEERGLGSMVFDYSGYGQSSGRIRTENLEEDLVSAYAELRRRVGPEVRVFVLGFSLGSGVAAAGIERLRPSPAGLFLCGAFSSFRQAARVVGWPGLLAWMVPDVWDTARALRGIEVPVCVVHSDGDRLFPMEMARRNVEACGQWGELVVVAGYGHDELYRRPEEGYWKAILERMR